jgi:(4S)-4-hydroxy-5-phosphonooxypentane-2,3-dione isomerase
MHVTLVEINVHEDKVDEFIEVFRQNHLGSVQEEGNLRFDVLQDPEVNSRFYIYEAYKDEDAVAFHKTTPHYKTCVTCIILLLKSAVTVFHSDRVHMPDQPFRYGEPPPVRLSSSPPDGQTGKYYAPYPHQKRPDR